GIDVYRPVAEGGRYDMIFACDDGLRRVQCKYARRKGEVVVVRAYSCRRTLSGIVNRTYSAAEIDAIVAYCPDNDACYYLPVGIVERRRVVHLRLGPSRNNQHRRINWADR